MPAAAKPAPAKKQAPKTAANQRSASAKAPAAKPVVKKPAAQRNPPPSPPTLTPSYPKEGMGAIPHAHGTSFRVWAPHAEAVAVVGEFNGWEGDATPLQHEADGYWAIDVPAARPGQQYKYQLKNGYNTFQRNDPYAREVTNSAGNSVIHEPHFDWGDDHFQMPAWNDLVIYELHVGTFNAPSEHQVGTFATVAEKLPYLRELGINCIELLPATEFPGSRSWGYNPANPFALESDYGGPVAFKQLVKEAHRYGIAVVLDVVYNHFGPGDLDLWQFDGWSENDGGGIYFYNDWRAETPWGHNRPDYGRPEVRQYIRDNALMWLTDYRVDGLRMDSISHVRSVNGSNDPEQELPDGWRLMRDINAEIDATLPWKICIAEDLRGHTGITAPVAQHGQGFDSQWDAAFVYPIRAALTAPHDADRDMHTVAAALGQTYHGDAFRRVIYTESHDEVANGKSRLPEEIMPGGADSWYSKKRAVLGGALVLTAPGLPMLFQGQEFLEDGSFNDTEPLHWSRAGQFWGLATLYRDLIALRRNLAGHTRGLGGQHTRVFHVNNEAKVIAFARWAEAEDRPGDATIVLANFANRAYDHYTIGLPAPGRWPARFSSDWAGYDGSFSDMDSFGMEAHPGPYDGYAWHGSVALAPYAVVVLSR